MRNVWSCSLVVLSVLLTGQAFAADEPGRLFEAAGQALERREYQRAATLFEQAYKLRPHPDTLFNAAAAWEQAGEAARAADGYELALAAEGLGDDQSEYARTRLSVLKRRLGYLSFRAPIGASVSVAHARNLSIPVSVHVEPGRHTVTIRRAGRDVYVGEHEVLAGESESIAPALPKPVVRQAPKPTVLSPTHSPPSQDSTTQGASGTWGFIALGTSAVLGGTAAVLGLQTLDARDEFEASGRRDLSERDRAITMRTWTNVAAAGAIVAAGVGVYLLLQGEDSEVLAKSGRSGAPGTFHF